MKKLRKALLLFSVLVICLCNVGTNVYATDAPTGVTVENCSLIFNVGYLFPDGDTFNDDITVVFSDIATDKIYQFVLTANSGYNASQTYDIVANTTYKVSLSFPSSNNYEIKNADGSKITSYAATADGLLLRWQITKKTDDPGNASSGSANLVTGTGAGITMLNTFIQKTRFIENDSNYSAFIGGWAGAIYKQRFLEVQGNTEEQWDSMTQYQRACYSLLYTYPKTLMLGENNSIYAKDKATFLSNLDLAKTPLLQLKRGNEVYDALVEAWNWHWANWEKDRVFLNPFEGMAYEQPDKANSKSSPKKSPDDNALANRKELASPHTFIDIVVKNIFTILILLGIGGYLAYVIYRNRSKNYYYDDEDE